MDDNGATLLQLADEDGIIQAGFEDLDVMIPKSQPRSLATLVDK